MLRFIKASGGLLKFTSIKEKFPCIKKAFIALLPLKQHSLFGQNVAIGLHLKIYVFRILEAYSGKLVHSHITQVQPTTSPFLWARLHRKRQANVLLTKQRKNLNQFFPSEIIEHGGPLLFILIIDDDSNPCSCHCSIKVLEFFTKDLMYTWFEIKGSKHSSHLAVHSALTL